MFRYLVSFFVVFSVISGSVSADTAGVMGSVAHAVSSDNISVPLLKGLKIDINDPLNIDFIFESCGHKIDRQDIERMIGYFFAAMAVPVDKIWVNLSPYEPDRVMEDTLALTGLGEDLLDMDYLLKQTSSAMTHPDTRTGRIYWGIENRKWEIENGSDPISNLESLIFTERAALSKIWISPEHIKVYDKDNVIIVDDAVLKLSSEVNRNTLLLPALRQEVNYGADFGTLRQIYYAAILAVWFKKKFCDSLYTFYMDKEKVSGIDTADKHCREKVFSLYAAAFKKGAYDVIRKESDPMTGRKVKRHYFSGGAVVAGSVKEVMDKAAILDNIPAINGAVVASAVSEFIEPVNYVLAPGGLLAEFDNFIDTWNSVSDFGMDLVRFGAFSGLKNKLGPDQLEAVLNGIKRSSMGSERELFCFTPADVQLSELGISRDSYRRLAYSIGGTKCRVALLDGSNKIIAEKEVEHSVLMPGAYKRLKDIDNEAADIMIKAALKLGAELVKENNSPVVYGISMALPGEVEDGVSCPRTTIINMPFNKYPSFNKVLEFAPSVGLGDIRFDHTVIMNDAQAAIAGEEYPDGFDAAGTGANEAFLTADGKILVTEAGHQTIYNYDANSKITGIDFVLDKTHGRYPFDPCLGDKPVTNLQEYYALSIKERENFDEKILSQSGDIAQKFIEYYKYDLEAFMQNETYPVIVPYHSGQPFGRVMDSTVSGRGANERIVAAIEAAKKDVSVSASELKEYLEIEKEAWRYKLENKKDKFDVNPVMDKLVLNGNSAALKLITEIWYEHGLGFAAVLAWMFANGHIHEKDVYSFVFGSTYNERSAKYNTEDILDRAMAASAVVLSTDKSLNGGVEFGALEGMSAPVVSSAPGEKLDKKISGLTFKIGTIKEYAVSEEYFDLDDDFMKLAG